MHNRIKVIENLGVKVMWVDFSKLPEDQMIELVIEASKYGRNFGDKLYILADFNKTPKSKTFNEQLKVEGKSYHKDGIDVKVAALGINSNLKRVIVNTTMIVTRIKNVKLFQDKETALKWLSEGEVVNFDD